MIVTKIDKKWYRAEQRVGSGILVYLAAAYSSTPIEAIKKLLKKEFKNLTS